MLNYFYTTNLLKPLTIGFVAGETSGDMLGAGLIHELKKIIPNVLCVGVTGPLMQAEGCKTWYHINELSFMGIIEIFTKLPKLIKIRTDLIKRFSKLKPAIFVGIDIPDFNFTIERELKQKGIKIVHYVSPSIWAWRYNRIFKIKKIVDLILIILPFEKKIYDKHNICYRFVGHHIADNIPLKPNKYTARLKLNIKFNSKCLVILPGSRLSEIKKLSKSFLYAAQLLIQDFPKLEIIVPLTNKECYQQFIIIYQNTTPLLPIKIFNGQSQTAMIAADIALLASGTASLECMLAKCPMVIGYRMNFITYFLAKILVRTPFISLPNLLANKKIVMEHIQKDCNMEQLAKSLKVLLMNKNNNKKIKNIFFKLHKHIKFNANKKAAKAILELNGI